ncbi:DMT family transporter, partial [Streptomyces sp. NPDC079189]
VAKGMRPPVVRSVVLAGAAGVAFGIASVFTKTVAMQWASGSVGAGLPSLVVIASLASAGLLLSQSAYRGAGLTAPLATVTVVNPVIASAVGITLFGEQFQHGTAGALLALACGVVAAGGLIMLMTERLDAEQREEQRVLPAGPDVPAVAAKGAAGSEEAEPALIVPPEPGRATAVAVGAAPPTAAAETLPAPLPLAVTMPLERRRVGQVDFGSARQPRTGSGRRGALSAEDGGAGDPTALHRTVQTLTPPARR